MDTSNQNPEFNTDQGFVQKKYATKKIIKGPDGKPQVIYVDSKTQQPIKNPKGYTIIESSNVIDPSLNQQRSAVTTTKGQTVQDPSKDETSLTNEIRGVSEHRGENPNITAAKQTGNQNQGYINKPMGTSLLGFLPQPFGLAATAANLGVNASNTKAVNDQREVLGFADNPTMKDLGSTVFDQHGYIGDQATIDKTGVQRTTPVSFEAEDSVGRTTLTPNEARMREQLNPEQFSEATVAAKQNAQTKFQQENPGWMSSLANSAKSMFSGIFGNTPTETAAGLNKSGVGSGNPSAFPSKPSTPTNTVAGYDNTKGPTGVDTSGYSPGLW